MFSRIATLASLAAFVAVASAAPGTLEARTVGCESGANYCCNSVFTTPQEMTGILGGILGVAGVVGVPVGLTCDPISAVIGLGGNSCATQCASCSETSQNGLVNIECVNANVGGL